MNQQDKLRLGPIYQPASLANAPDGTKGTIQLPGAAGGALWEAAAADPETGILYVGSSTSPTRMALENVPERSDVRFISAGLSAPNVRGLPLIKPPWGRITAIDLSTGNHLWMVPNGDTPREIRNHPALKDIKLPRTGSQSRAGIVVTKTLLFAGEGWGGQPMFRAYDKRTGEIVWQMELPAVQTGLPMTYMVKDKQYIVLSVGADDHPAEFVALSLPERREPAAAARPRPAVVAREPGDNTLTPAELSQGWILLFDGQTLSGWEPRGTRRVEGRGGQYQRRRRSWPQLPAHHRRILQFPDQG